MAATEKKNEIALAPARLPWHPGIQDRFGIDAEAWRVLTDAVFPAAQTTGAVELALSYCKARKLDPFKHPVHVVPIWNKEKRCLVETVWPGIAEHRTTAMRTGQYAGADAAAFGPTLTKTFEGETKEGQKKAELRFPEWCQITLYRMVGGQRMPVPGPRVYWLETYSRMGRTELPNDMWMKRPSGQLEKCAEAAALRKAFPEELGNEITADEAEGMDMHVPADQRPDAPKRADFKGDPLKVVEAVMAGEAEPAPTDATFGLPMEWPAPTADRRSWNLACIQAAKEIAALDTELLLDNWMSINGGGVNSLMIAQRDFYDALYAKWDARKQEVAGE